MDNIREETKNFIEDTINSNNVVIFMKGTKDFPQCGFSASVIAILEKLNLEFLDINVLENNDLREGIKEYTDWPTIPQLYIKGEFIGGCDIVKELFSTGELNKILEDKKITYKK